MTAQNVGVLHPGAMGSYVAATMLNSGNLVFWASQGRSQATLDRAEKLGLKAVHTVAELCDSCDILVSVCPPHAALEVAQEVLSNNFRGIYIDANAISPMKAQEIANLLEPSGIDFVDGGIIGPPVWNNGNTCLYLSGTYADKAGQFFHAGPLKPRLLGKEIGKASAMKMCYAAYTKGTTALLTNILALAQHHNIREDLSFRWEEDWPGLMLTARSRIERSSQKAWRFTGEMEEIAETFAKADLPDLFHKGAAQLYARLAGFKDYPQPAKMEEILRALLDDSQKR